MCTRYFYPSAKHPFSSGASLVGPVTLVSNDSIVSSARKNSCSNSGKKKPLTNVVFGTDFEQVYFSPRSISLESLNYRQYSTNQKLAQIQNKRRLSNVICADFNYAPAWWSTATF